MPLNESKGSRRSGLSKQQKHEAMAAIYGLPTETVMQQFTPEDIERMRAVLEEYDRKNTAPIKTFDLNNPPTPRYVHQEFPKMVYDHEARKTKIVRNQAELAEHVEDGWLEEAFVAEDPREVELDAASAREAADVDRRLAELRRKKAKTRKAKDDEQVAS